MRKRLQEAGGKSVLVYTATSNFVLKSYSGVRTKYSCSVMGNSPRDRRLACEYLRIEQQSEEL